MKKISCALLIDDDTTTNYINQMLLDDMGAASQVLIATNGAEALKVLQQHCQENTCPELILLDLNMPVMNGIEFLEAYVELELGGKQSVIIVVLTTSMHPLDLEKLKNFPIRGILNKPLSQEHIKGLMEECFIK